MNRAVLFITVLLVQQTDLDFLLQKARRAIEAGRLEEASHDLARARRLEPDSPAVHYRLAELGEARGDLGSAVAGWRRVIELAPDDPQAYLRLALLEAGAGRRPAALATLNRLIKRLPDEPAGYKALGQIAAESGRLEVAEKRFRELLRLSPRDAEGWSLLGAVLASQRQSDEAVAAFDKALRYDPDLAAAHQNLGLVRVERGELGAALRDLGTAARLAPSSAEIHCALGTVWRRLQDDSSAEKSFKEALRLRPDYPEALYGLAGLLRDTGRAVEATGLLRTYQQSNSRRHIDQQQQRRLGSLHSEVRLRLEADDLEAASALLSRILDADADNALAHYRQGQIAFVRGDSERAVTLAHKARRLNPIEPAYANLEAAALARLGRVDEAVAAYQIVIDLSDDVDAYIASAGLLGRSQRLAEGVALLKQGVRRQPENRKLGSALIAALETSGDKPAADAIRRQMGLPESGG